jgi:CheY-like chemotaxis protein
MLIVMDIKIPRMSGFDALEWVRSEEGLKNIPVVMLSSSTMESDKERACKLGVSAYISKPIEFKELQHIYRIIVEYWDLLSQNA